MARHDPVVRIRHMLDHAREAVAMVESRSRADLDTDRMINFDILWAIVYADLPNLIKQLEVIVENA